TNGPRPLRHPPTNFRLTPTGRFGLRWLGSTTDRGMPAVFVRPAAEGAKPGPRSPSVTSRFRERPRGQDVNALLALSRDIDAVNFRIGKVLSWLILAAVIVSATNAIIRKLFDTSSNAWLELQWVLFGTVFLLCSSWTMLANEHIRIDIVNNLLPKRT